MLEDGKPRPIVSFTPVDLPEAAPAPPNAAAWTREVAPDVTTNTVPPDGRLVVIMFDWSIRAQDLQLARRIAHAAIDDLGPNDQAAVVFSSPLANAAAKQDFTADRARLIAAINRPVTTARLNPPIPSDADIRNGNGVMLDDPEGYESGDCNCRLCVTDMVTSVANTLRDVQGRRKLLLFIGTFFQGFELSTPEKNPTPVGRSPFVPYFNAPGSATPSASGEYEGQCSAQLNGSMEKMRQAAGLANLTIDTFDPSGLSSPGSDPMGGMEKYTVKRRDDLHIMPDATGGRTVLDINDPESQIPAALAESRSYYLVGFTRGSAANDGKVHSLSVKVNRPGVTVRTRNGYLATDALALAEAPESAPIARSLDGVLPNNGLPLVAAAAAFAPATRSGPANVAVIVGIPGIPGIPGINDAPSQTQPSAATPALTGPARHHIVVALFDTNGRSLAKAEQTVTTTAARGASSAAAPLEVLSILPAMPGHYEVRAAVDDRPDGRGSVYTFVDVPDFAKEPVSMSGILVHTVPAVPISIPTEIKAVLPAAPTARRTFGANDHVTASLRLYQRPGDAPVAAVVTTRIVDAHDKNVFDQSATIDAARFGAAHTADYSIELPIGGLESGEYLLTIDATAGSHTAHRDLRFTRSAGAVTH